MLSGYPQDERAIEPLESGLQERQLRLSKAEILSISRSRSFSEGSPLIPVSLEGTKGWARTEEDWQLMGISLIT